MNMFCCFSFIHFTKIDVGHVERWCLGGTEECYSKNRAFKNVCKAPGDQV
jgi:hypothetical protein